MGRSSGAGRRVRLGDGEREAEVGGELAGDADDAHRVGPVRGDREVEDRVVEAEELADVGAGRGGRVEVEDAVVVVAEAELARRTEHAVGDLAADLAPLDGHPAGEGGAGGGERGEHAGVHVRGAAHDAGGAVAGVDVDEAEPVGVGVGDDVEDPRDGDAGELGAGGLDGFDLEADLVQGGDDLVDGPVEGGEVPDPGQRGRARQYCSRKRMSLSTKVRISSMPWRIMASRSSPNPNAKPCHSSGSMPTAVKTLGSTMPQPPSSIQPVWEQTRQPGAVAEHAADGELGGGLGVGEVVGAEPGADGLVVEEAAGEHLDGAEQVGHGEVVVDGEALELVEHG